MKIGRVVMVVLWLTMCASIAQAAAPAAKPANRSAAPDIEFLEYLGTLESEDENWTDVVEMQKPKRAAEPKADASADAKVKAAQNPPRRVQSSNER